MEEKRSKYSFDLNDTEINNLEEFLELVPKKHRDLPLEITFSFGSGIGVGVTAKKGAYSKDITDYSRW